MVPSILKPCFGKISNQICSNKIYFSKSVISYQKIQDIWWSPTLFAVSITNGFTSWKRKFSFSFHQVHVQYLINQNVLLINNFLNFVYICRTLQKMASNLNRKSTNNHDELQWCQIPMAVRLPPFQKTLTAAPSTSTVKNAILASLGKEMLLSNVTCHLQEKDTSKGTLSFLSTWPYEPRLIQF